MPPERGRLQGQNKSADPEPPRTDRVQEATPQCAVCAVTHSAQPAACAGPVSEVAAEAAAFDVAGANSTSTVSEATEAAAEL